MPARPPSREANYFAAFQRRPGASRAQASRRSGAGTMCAHERADESDVIPGHTPLPCLLRILPQNGAWARQSRAGGSWRAFRGGTARDVHSVAARPCPPARPRRRSSLQLRHARILTGARAGYTDMLRGIRWDMSRYVIRGERAGQTRRYRKPAPEQWPGCIAVWRDSESATRNRGRGRLAPARTGTALEDEDW